MLVRAGLDEPRDDPFGEGCRDTERDVVPATGVDHAAYDLVPRDLNQFRPGKPSFVLDITTEGTPFDLVPDSIPGKYRDLFDGDLDDLSEENEGLGKAFRFLERIIESDGTVYVAGSTERAPASSDADVVISGGEGPTDFVIGNKPESGTESIQGYWIPAILALPFLGIGVWVVWFAATLVGRV